MIKMVGINSSSNYVTAYIDTNITANNNALYNPALSPNVNIINAQFTNPRMFSKYKSFIIFISSTDILRIVRFYNNSLFTDAVAINGTIVTPISDGFGNN